jgi:hypothetical protein
VSIAVLTTLLLRRTSHRIQSIKSSPELLKSLCWSVYAHLTLQNSRGAWSRTPSQFYNTSLLTRCLCLPSQPATHLRATVFFTQLGRLFQYQFATARFIYGTLFTLSLTLVRHAYWKRAPGSSSVRFLTEQWAGTRALLLAFGGALIGANSLTTIIHRV